MLYHIMDAPLGCIQKNTGSDLMLILTKEDIKKVFTMEDANVGTNIKI
ncbi:hypothetical protein [Clostridium algidicarnis]|nr:hypothetical protein [Clostridium algidicarnis]